jgi:hypothetical protein
MNVLSRLVLLFAVLKLCSSAALFALAADNEEGFVPLFNGKDTTGWEYPTPERKIGKGYQVENGVLLCTKENSGDLFTEKEYDNFILRFEFKLQPNSNNGIGIRAPLQGGVAYSGIEIQVLDDSGSEYQKLKPWQYHGSIYGCVAAKRGSLKSVGEWNSEEIVADGRHIKVTLNGNVIVDANLDKDVTDPEVIKAHPGLARKTGRIALLGHGTRVEFRNIRVKPL